MGCVRILKNGKESILYKDLVKAYGDELSNDNIIADNIYAYVYSDTFAKQFGDWIYAKESLKHKLDINGEPLIKYVTFDRKTQDIFNILIENKAISSLTEGGAFTVLKSDNEIKKLIGEYPDSMYRVDDYLFMDARYLNQAFVAKENNRWTVNKYKREFESVPYEIQGNISDTFNDFITELKNDALAHSKNNKISDKANKAYTDKLKEYYNIETNELVFKKSMGKVNSISISGKTNLIGFTEINSNFFSNLTIEKVLGISEDNFNTMNLEEKKYLFWNLKNCK